MRRAGPIERWRGKGIHERQRFDSACTLRGGVWTRIAVSVGALLLGLLGVAKGQPAAPQPTSASASTPPPAPTTSSTPATPPGAPGYVAPAPSGYVAPAPPGTPTAPPPLAPPGALGYVTPAPPGTPLGPNAEGSTPTPWDEGAAEERREEAEERQRDQEEQAEYDEWLAQRDPNVISRVAIVPRFGVTLGGLGRSQAECVGDCFGLGGDTTYVHRTNLVVQFTALFRVGRMVRLGPGMTYRTPMRVDTELHNRVVLGTEVSLNLEGEVAYPIAEKMWLAPRGEFSVLQLFAEDDTEARLDAIQAACVRAPQPQQCDRDAALGLGGGAGVGWIYGWARARVRLDFLVSYYWIDLGRYAAAGEELRWTLSGVRSGLLVGGDFL